MREKINVDEKKVLRALAKKEGRTAPEIADGLGLSGDYAEGKVAGILRGLADSRQAVRSPREIEGGGAGRRPYEYKKA